MLQPGTLLQGRYRIDGLLGQGGMGTVYKARQVRLADRAVAIKELIPSGPDAERSAFVHQFQREARILATLQHPGLVDVKDFFDENDCVYLVMDFIDGLTLAQIVREPATRSDVGKALEWALQLTEVLHYLHNHQPVIVLRDLKPGNIMVEKSGRVRVIDFGIAREFQTTDTSSTLMRGAGSPGYAPPEQYGAQADPRSDIYSLGATLYAVLCARVPPVSVMLMSGEEKLWPLHEVNPVVSPKLSKLIHHMMAVRREERPQNVGIVETLLKRAQEAQQAFDRGDESTVESGPLEATPTRPLPTGRVCSQCGVDLIGDDCPSCASMLPDPEEQALLLEQHAKYWNNVLPKGPASATAGPPDAGRIPVPEHSHMAWSDPPTTESRRRVPWGVMIVVLLVVGAVVWGLRSRLDRGGERATTVAQAGTVWQDPQGQCSMAIPTGWRYGTRDPAAMGSVTPNTRLVMFSPDAKQFAVVECYPGTTNAQAAVDDISQYASSQGWKLTLGKMYAAGGYFESCCTTRLEHSGTAFTGNSYFTRQGHNVWRVALMGAAPTSLLQGWRPRGE